MYRVLLLALGEGQLTKPRLWISSYSMPVNFTWRKVFQTPCATSRLLAAPSAKTRKYFAVLSGTGTQATRNTFQENVVSASKISVSQVCYRHLQGHV